MAKKTYSAISEGALIQAATLNDNFSNLADVVNTVDKDQFAREALTWDNNYASVAGISTAGTTADAPCITSVHTANASLNVAQNVTFSATASPAVLTDGFNNFMISFVPATESHSYTIESGDAIRYWFGASVIFYNNTGTEATEECVVLYPQFRFTVGGSVGAWLDAYPTPVSADFAGPAAFIGGAIRGSGVDYQTVRSAAGTGRGPGSWRSVSLEGILPIVINNVTKVDIRIVGYGVGTTPTDLRLDLTSANFQSVYLRKCYDV